KAILVVDDNPSVRHIVARVLAEEGYHVLAAANGVEAVEVAAANDLDLVILDLIMPQQGGWDVFEKLTSEKPFLPVIIVTARPGQLFTAVGAGVAALLEKPLDYPKLLETVRAVLAESSGVRLARVTGHQADFRYLSAIKQMG